MVKNGNKWPKIANNCQISEITKYGEKMPKMYKNVKNEPKTAKKLPNLKQQKMHSFSGSKLPQKIVTLS